MYGSEPINPREHMDALEFFASLGDQLDAHLKKASLPPVFERTFGGTMASQKIGLSCPHRYNRFDDFSSIPAVVRNNKNLLDALEESVKGERLSGANAYECAQCNAKVDALMRTCVARLPRVLVVQLKRFEYDWDTQRPIKFNDR
jgi:ubiquitin carboxyl-terminal hydrolase 9/24